MKKINLIIAFVLSLLASIVAQVEPNAVRGALGVWEEGAEYVTLVSDANLRESPNTQAKVLTTMPIGTKIKMEKITTDSLLLNGIKAPWCKVKMLSGGKNLSGFMWGGFIATVSMPSQVEEGLMYVIGVSSWDNKKHRMALQVRAVKNGKEIAKTDINVAGDLSYNVTFKTQNTYSLKNVKEALSLETGYDACGYPWTNDLVFWTGQKLMPILQTNSVSDAGAFYSSEDFILPSDKGGIANCIILSKDQAEYKETPNGSDYELVNQQYQLQVYRWNGAKLQLVKSLK